ncbi:MAG: GH36-type glycosyl hydrolase domain-containing protein [Gammaproteobacteria bacterium]
MRPIHEPCAPRLRAKLPGPRPRPAYYDEGPALGSAQSDECRIDALAQAWAAISGAASSERRAQALDAVERYLVSEPDGLIRLLTPPFDKRRHTTQAISRAMSPGVRENGGQYGRTLVLEPRIPASWPGFTLRYRLPDRVTCYHITVVNEAGAQGIVAAATLDGTALLPEQGRLRVPLVRDGGRHELRVSLR